VRHAGDRPKGHRKRERAPISQAVRHPASQDVEGRVHNQKSVDGQSEIGVRQRQLPPYLRHDYAYERAVHVVQHRARKEEESDEPSEAALLIQVVTHEIEDLYYISHREGG
jgi:hypothetical protein